MARLRQFDPALGGGSPRRFLPDRSGVGAGAPASGTRKNSISGWSRTVAIASIVSTVTFSRPRSMRPT